MNIGQFIRNFTNHPVLFVGTGLSLRYLENSYTWDGLLASISRSIKGSDEFYYDLKSDCTTTTGYNYPAIALALEAEFNEVLKRDRNGPFKNINDMFYANAEKQITISRFKLYISELLQNYSIRASQTQEVNELKKVRKNIGSVITTNYDKFIEDIFEFTPLIGNDILLSTPYGSVYKIHGCVDDPNKIIISTADYTIFDERYELIRAQLLSLFIHNPIIFLGYNIGDNNIKSILKTIFTYIDHNTPEAERIRKNFLLVEYEAGSNNTEVTDHDIDINGIATIRINKIKTDNYLEIYKHLANLDLPVTALDIRKVQSVVKEIYAGGNGGQIKVSITEDIDTLKNGEKILAIGSIKTIKYDFQTTSEMMENYFKIIDESNHQLLELINKHRIASNQYFPIMGFGLIQRNIGNFDTLLNTQAEKVKSIVNGHIEYGNNHSTIDEIILDETIPQTRKLTAISAGIISGRIDLGLVEAYLRNYDNKKSTDYRRLLCVYDLKKYGREHGYEMGADLVLRTLVVTQ